MRSEQAFKNMAANLFLQIVVFISGIILPRFILQAYGSSINGMITSVNQFLTYLGLAEAGVATASVVALYTPLALGRKDEVNSILSAARKFYNRSGVLFLSLTAVLVFIYPFFISGQLDNSLVRWMIVVLAGSTLVDYFFLGKYRVLLMANQEGYVVALIQSAGTVANMVVSIGLIYAGASVLAVKAVATGVYVLRLFLVKAYAKKKYPDLDFHAQPAEGALKQKNAALFHQVVTIIVNNTDTTILTICLGSRSLLEVSVYGIYMLVVNAVNQLLTSFSNGLTAGFGEVIARREEETLKKSYSDYEYMFFLIFFVVVACMGVLLIPFISVYTIDMKDVQYVRPVIAALFTLLVFLQNVRIPGLTIICAAGHYKETRYQAGLEAAINIVVSLALVWSMGMTGVLLGTVCSYGYRSFEIILYTNRHLIQGTAKTAFSRIIRNLVVTAVLIAAGIWLIPQNMTSFINWFIYAVAAGVVSVVLIVGVNYIAEPQEFKNLILRILGIVSRKKH
ncbi:hypothetical protein H6B07_05160 [Mediterraneibacter glycyrrhizinilyticus]|uniref:lipopolysaccharide biosynthesis protein n=1 Tax=Mediterraneibacter glycyrrhizinilyticus TaxID=342942 RepID=UPI00195F5C7A|nr:hypothetical protein [Mediterraneibacter glycyrrhizinilyticus]MBM6802066.1 hypothetical protein [Mediterraneibacter glycyrrhizinilyticus]MDM8125555.1 hypothetical protein [Mediterraneibacter glycyrrhizinilyticus]